jgi:hypothetical protein
MSQEQEDRHHMILLKCGIKNVDLLEIESRIMFVKDQRGQGRQCRKLKMLVMGTKLPLDG